MLQYKEEIKLQDFDTSEQKKEDITDCLCFITIEKQNKMAIDSN